MMVFQPAAETFPIDTIERSPLFCGFYLVIFAFKHPFASIIYMVSDIPLFTIPKIVCH
jgi:hypothetical protein